MKNRPVVLKIGGELLEGPGKLTAIGKVIKRASARRPLVVVHGGGREIDAALASVGIPKRQVDGLRVTDPETLDIVVSVLAGSINTRFVAAINSVGGKAVGLTGADARVAPVTKAAPHKATSGDTVDLGMVGTKPAEWLLAAILDPSQTVEARYRAWTITPKSGDVLDGLVSVETANNLVLRLAGGVEHAVLRSDIAAMSPSKLSLMPTGFESALKPQDMADLLRWLRAP